MNPMRRMATTLMAALLLAVALTVGTVPKAAQAVTPCVTVYEDAYYSNDHWTICYPNNIRNFEYYSTGLVSYGACNGIGGYGWGDWNDCISSFRVSDISAYRVPCFFTDANGWGVSIRGNTSLSTLGTANDKISSLYWDTNGATCWS